MGVEGVERTFEKEVGVEEMTDCLPPREEAGELKSIFLFAVTLMFVLIDVEE
jgi:hypothetical protein